MIIINKISPLLNITFHDDDGGCDHFDVKNKMILFGIKLLQDTLTA